MNILSICNYLKNLFRFDKILWWTEWDLNPRPLREIIPYAV